MIVAVFAVDRAVGYELMLPGQVFGMANLTAAEPDSPTWGGIPSQRAPFEIRMCGPRSSITTAAEFGSVDIATPYGLDDLVQADVVCVPGTADFLERPDSQTLSVLGDAFAAGARIASLCVGAFTVAAAGLLDGRRATTHWQFADELARRYPRVDVDPRVLFVDEGPVLSSAGVSSGIDLCLHLIRQSAGHELASRTARRIVVPAWRDGGQAQFAEDTGLPAASHPLQSTVDWMKENVRQSLDLQTIADHATVSVRTLNRQFRDHFGTTPLGLLIRFRVDEARRLLEGTTLPIERIAEQSGFGSYASLRHHFARTVGVSPQKYRQTYVLS